MKNIGEGQALKWYRWFRGELVAEAISAHAEGFSITQAIEIRARDAGIEITSAELEAITVDANNTIISDNLGVEHSSRP